MPRKGNASLALRKSVDLSTAIIGLRRHLRRLHVRLLANAAIGTAFTRWWRQPERRSCAIGCTCGPSCQRAKDESEERDEAFRPLPSRSFARSVILVTVGVAAGLGIALTYVAYIISYGLPARPVPFWEGQIGASTLGQLSRIGFSAAALIVGSGAAVIAYRNQRVKEEAHARSESREYQDRFLSAANQIGSENASIRIAGVYAMSLLAAQLADAWFSATVRGRSMCISPNASEDCS